MSIVNLYRKDNQPFAQIPNDAIRDPRITPNAFRLLAYLMSHQDGYTLNYEQIERQTTLGRYAINQAAQQLTELGWIAVDRPKVNGRFVAKSWTVLDPSSANRSTADDSTMEQPHMGQSTDIRRPLNKENQVNKKTTVKELSDSEKLQTEFNEFWDEYKHKIGKPEAYKAFIKARRKVTFETILWAIPRYHAYLVQTGYNPANPATWLNQCRWQDEPALAQPQSNPRQQQQRNARAEFEAATTQMNPPQITDGNPF